MQRSGLSNVVFSQLNVLGRQYTKLYDKQLLNTQ